MIANKQDSCLHNSRLNVFQIVKAYNNIEEYRKTNSSDAISLSLYHCQFLSKFWRVNKV